MSSAAPPAERPSRFDVRAPDGTSIAVWVAGTGPPLVLVHGSLADHRAFDSFVAVLGADMTTYSMDRRGFGASGDTPPYSIDQDFADVAAVVDAVAARTGGPVALWGHSYGANGALGGAALTPHVHHLVLYEPSLGLAYAPGAIERVEAALARGNHDEAVAAVLVDPLGVPPERIDALRAHPRWPERLATAPTIARECRAEESWVYRPGRFAAVTVPTLVLVGSDSIPALQETAARAAAAIPHAETHMLAGHGHFAYRTDPALVAAVVRRFFAEDSD